MSGTDIREVVKEKYGQAALRVTSGGSSCCGGSPATGSCDPITSNLYDAAQSGQIPEEALLASLGCGNPTALAKLNPGEVVLDLGSGGGIDVLLSAKRVGPTGKAYGLDMTDEMLALANENKRKSGTENVEFLHGEIENIPLPDNSVDVVISNCVINLSADKDRVLREAFRVLKPGGRFAVSDVVTRGEILPEIRKSVLLWVGCVAGALDENEYRGKLASRRDSSKWSSSRRGSIASKMPENFFRQNIECRKPWQPQVDGKFMSAFVRAVKPRRHAAGPTAGFREIGTMESRYNVLFLCTGNSARSIMAEAIMNHKGGRIFTAYSAGSHPTGIVRPEALRQSKGLTCPQRDCAARTGMSSRDLGAPELDFVFTVCDNAAKEVCPMWPGQPMTAHWGVAGSGGREGTADQVVKAFRDAFFTLDRRISLFLSLPIASLDKLALKNELDRIGHQ